MGERDRTLRIHKEISGHFTECGIAYQLKTNRTWRSVTCKNCLAVKARREKNKK